jgi:hypothetical protein
MDESTIERLHTPSPELQELIQRFKNQIPDDKTLQDIQIETLTTPDYLAWNRYMHLIQQLAEILHNDAVNVSTQKALFDRVLRNISSVTFGAWMRNRITIITADLDIINEDPTSRSAIREYIEEEKRRFT